MINGYFTVLTAQTIDKKIGLINGLFDFVCELLYYLMGIIYQVLVIIVENYVQYNKEKEYELGHVIMLCLAD